MVALKLVYITCYKIVHSHILKSRLYVMRQINTAWSQITYRGYPSLLRFRTEYKFNCKRAILFLSSSKILTPPPPSPSPPGESVLPPQQRRGVHTRRAEMGMGGVNILEDERNRIALLQKNMYSVRFRLQTRWWSNTQRRHCQCIYYFSCFYKYTGCGR